MAYWRSHTGCWWYRFALDVGYVHITYTRLPVVEHKKDNNEPISHRVFELKTVILENSISFSVVSYNQIRLNVAHTTIANLSWQKPCLIVIPPLRTTTFICPRVAGIIILNMIWKHKICPFARVHSGASIFLIALFPDFASILKFVAWDNFRLKLKTSPLGGQDDAQWCIWCHL